MENLEMWDYIALGALLLAVWVGTYGIKMCRESIKEGFNEKSLRNKALGTATASLLYLLIRFCA